MSESKYIISVKKLPPPTNSWTGKVNVNNETLISSNNDEREMRMDLKNKIIQKLGLSFETHKITMKRKWHVTVKPKGTDYNEYLDNPFEITDLFD